MTKKAYSLGYKKLSNLDKYMEIKQKKSGENIIIHLNGSLDIYTSSELRSFIESEFNSNYKCLVINLGNLKYIDSSGIGMLLKNMNFVKEQGGVFKLANLKPPIEKVFKVAGLTNYFPIISEIDFNETYNS